MGCWHVPVARLASVVLLLVVAATALGEAAPVRGGKLWVYVGTYTGGKSKGIYRVELDTESSKLGEPHLAAEITSPSFLAIHPNRRFLYAVNEVGDFKGKKTGAVSAFAIDADTGSLTLLNQQSSGGSGPCYVAVDRAGKNALVANYGGGSAAVLPIGKDGRLGETTSVVQHKGSGSNPARQEGPHAHSINLDPANRFAFVCDLGLDQILVYRFDGDKGTLTPNDPPAVNLPPGSGPRHFAFHPSGKFAYVINEMSSTITAMTYDAEKGVLKKEQTISTLPKGYKGDTSTAEVQVHPSGKFAYGSNRGQDSIAIFTVDERTGKLTAAGHQGKGVKVPRNFGIDPTGKFLLVANQGADDLVLFRIDPRSGGLEPTDQTVKVGAPVCVKMMPAPGGKR